MALVLFSSLEVVSKPIMDQVTPFTVTFLRFFIGGLFLFLISKRNIRGRDLFSIILIGSLNCIVSMTLLQLSVKYGNASSAATLISTSPMFTAFFAAYIIQEHLSLKKKFGIALGLFGIIVFGFGMLEGDTLAGILFGVAASVTFALYSVLMKKHVAKYGAVNCTAYSTLFPSLIYGTGLLVTGNLTIPDVGIKGWLIILYLGIFVTGVAYYSLLESVNRMGASMAMRLFYVKPVLATLLAFSMLNEPFGLVKLMGMGIIIFSLTL